MKKNNYLEGIYRRNAKGFGFVKVENMEDEIYISKDKSKNALNEDKVLIEINMSVPKFLLSGTTKPKFLLF